MLNTERALFNNLIGFIFLASIAAGAVFYLALEYAVGAVWSTPFRRVTEFLGYLFPFVIIFSIPVLLNMHTLFHWSHSDAVAADKLLQVKAPYLNTEFFYIRNAVIVAVWIIFFYAMSRNSLIQDLTKDQRITKTNIKLGVAFIPIFAISISLFGIDWLMSLEPHWFSTIFGVYFFSGTVLGSLAVITYFVVDFAEKGLFFKGIRKDHYYTFGALLFGFISFWAYIAFSQFMLIWYANLPEENFWFIERWENGWKIVSIAMTLVHFWIPYFMLVARPSKMSPKNLKLSAVIIVLAHFLDLYWIVMPMYNSSPVFGFYEAAFPILSIGIILLVISRRARKYNLVPIGDPKLQRGIDFRL
ncbi:MAG: quinol:cytochrome C oxidoreductase [Bacteroidetes bacterium]|nr:quinol:cytochrome C oxidoreductase [Bacteroidota bacterium]